MKTAITELLNIEAPVIQGGMAWVAEHCLAASVSEAGGLGIIGAASAPAQWVREQNPPGKREDREALWCEYHADESLCG